MIPRLVITTGESAGIGPDIVLDTEKYTPDQCASYLFNQIVNRLN